MVKCKKQKMINISIDVDDLIQEFNLPANTADFIVNSVVEDITTALFRNWQNAAKRALNSTRNDYINSLVISQPSKFSRTITLKGAFNNMLEKGVGPYDLKNSFANSKKIKFNKKGGWYLTIPFRHAVSGSLGENSAFSSVMPKDVHAVAKMLPAKKAMSKSMIPSPYDTPKSRQAITTPTANFPMYTHKSSIYEGMTKQVGAYGKTNQNTYKSFRRVGENSDPMSWITKGIKAYNLLDEAIKRTDVNTIANNKVDDILKTIL